MKDSSVCVFPSLILLLRNNQDQFKTRGKGKGISKEMEKNAAF